MTTVYSQRLGAIGDEQLHAVVQRHGLGHFLHAAPITQGLFGQNLFLTTTEGEFVLRGAPHWVRGPDDADYRPEDRWQFTKERFFAEQLHLKTQTPSPWPMLYDQQSDLLGWPYLVMPRMPGECLSEQQFTALSAPDRSEIAVALGNALAEMQTLTHPFAGDFDVNTIALTPFAGGHTAFVVNETQRNVASARSHDALTAQDLDWINAQIASADGLDARVNTYVHVDFKLGNLTLLRDEESHRTRWRVAGLFDFHEGRFGDGSLDLVRQGCAFLDIDAKLAAQFFASYLQQRPQDSSLANLLPLYVVNDRLKIWEYFSRPEVNARFTRGTTFMTWADGYLARLMPLL